MPRFREEPIAPLLGTFVVEVVRDDLHHGVVDLALEELHRWLVENPETFTEVLDRAGAVVGADPAQRGGDRTRIHTEAVRWLEDIRDDPRHHAREALDSHARRSSARTCCSTPRPRTAPRGSSAAARPPAVRRDRHLAVERACAGPCSQALRDPAGPVRDRLQQELVAFADRLTADEVLRARMDGLAADAAVFAVERYGAELTAVITHTIERWDGKEAARPDRAARRPRPAVHPDQRHHRRRPGRRADPHRDGAALMTDPMSEPIDVPIRDESIRLGQFLKLANLVESGSEAKPLIAGGAVLVNGEVETRRGRQLVKGDVVTLAGQSARVSDESAPDNLPW